MTKEIKRLIERVANSEGQIATDKALIRGMEREIERMQFKLATAKDWLVCAESDREIYNDALKIAMHDFVWVMGK